MRITKLETKLDSILDGNYFLAAKNHTASAQRLPYQVLLSCHSSAAAAVEQMLLAQLHDGFEQGYELHIATRSHQPVVDFSVLLACSTAERAALVRLVSQLGQHTKISSLRWQSASGRQA